MRSVREIDLTPKTNKRYWRNCHREWREEFIYFLLVDRFHDDQKRAPIEKQIRHRGFGKPEELQKICGGTLNGITNHLDYIYGLGCTALWLSPVFENNPESYHGYAIENYLEVDKRFGTKEELEALVEKAHALDMRVFLDITLHHSGDNWFYPNDLPYYYYEGAEFPLAGWRYNDLPVPMELRDPKLYNRKGRIRNYDSYPETRDGDFMELKTFRNDDSAEALFIQDILVKLHCYWMREVDIDGFRIDAVKHIGELANSRFCSHIREYAYKLGKRNFFLFGELVGPEDMYNRYIGPKTSASVDHKSIYYGLNSVLDFPLFKVLPDVITGKASPEKLIERYESLRKTAVARGEYGAFLVTFIDNHDQVGQSIKHRFGKDSLPEQVIAGVGFLLCALGTPCIYYGTEQGFEGYGDGDWSVREAMFSLDDESTNALDVSSSIYKGISKIAALRKENAILKFGRMYISKVSTDGINFHFPYCKECLLAFSRVLHDEEMVIAYNISSTEAKEEFVTIGKKETVEFQFIYGDTGKIKVETDADGLKYFIRLKLNPMQFVILSNIR
jgi:glycosidase